MDSDKLSGVGRSGEEGTVADQKHHLELLAKRIEDFGFHVRLVSPNPGSRPFLRVLNPSAAVLNERITVSEAGWFVWSWGEAMSAVDEIDSAAAQIAYVLTPANPKPTSAPEGSLTDDR